MSWNTFGWIRVASTKRTLSSSRMRLVLCSAGTATRNGAMAVQRSTVAALYKSTWFTRGWTLQELLAPQSVEFFSSEGVRLGDRCSLEQQICDITKIPASALQGGPLSRFSREMRFKWSSLRKRSKPEDKAYSLLGIFDIEMPVDYNEGAGRAIERLERAIERRDECIRDIRLSDPRDDKKRIEENKGGLIKDAYSWNLQNPQFQQWCIVESSSILWIKGDPGKGKTMLLCGIIDELLRSSNKPPILSYFFCQATDTRANHTVAVLRGLMFMLVCEWPSLVSHIRVQYDSTGKVLFEDGDACIALTRALRSMLGDPILDGAYLIIDALDECLEDQPKLLDIICAASTHPCVKWVVSSRNERNIESAINKATQAVKLSLELNEESVSTAVTTYIGIKVRELAQRNTYNHSEQVKMVSGTDSAHSPRLRLQLLQATRFLLGTNPDIYWTFYKRWRGISKKSKIWRTYSLESDRPEVARVKGAEYKKCNCLARELG